MTASGQVAVPWTLGPFGPMQCLVIQNNVTCAEGRCLFYSTRTEVIGGSKVFCPSVDTCLDIHSSDELSSLLRKGITVLVLSISTEDLQGLHTMLSDCSCAVQTRCTEPQPTTFKVTLLAQQTGAKVVGIAMQDSC